MSHGTVKNAKNGRAQNVESGRESPESLTAPPPDGGWGWMVVFASLLVHIITDGITYSFGVIYDDLLNYFEEGQGKTALIHSLLVGVTLSSGPISSSLVNRWGCRTVTIAGALISAVCIMLSALAQNILTLILTIGVGAGFGFGLIYLPAIVSVTVWFERYRSLATGIAVCGAGLGTFIFAPLTSTLIANYGWRGTMVIIGAIILNCVPLGLIFKPVPELPQTPASEPMLPESSTTPLKRSQSTEQMVRANGKVEDSDVARLTLSQPALNKPHEHKKSIHSRHGSGIMQRPDVLYQGSIASLAKFHSRAPSQERQQHISNDNQEPGCSWLPCSDESKSTLREMLDLSLLVDPVFILFCISNFLTSIGFYIPYMYTVPMSKQLGVQNSEYLISIIGASNLVGRIVLGYISDKPWVNRMLVYSLCLIIAGLATSLAMACWEFWGLAMYATTFGFTTGAYVGLTSVVLVDLVGIDKLTNAFGLLLLAQGVASLVGSPLVGWIYDIFKSYAPGFYSAGGAISLSGLILFLIPFFERRKQRQLWNQETDSDNQHIATDSI